MDVDPIAVENLLPERPRRLRRAEYDQMVAMGMFSDERVELLQGVLIAMAPNDPPHASPVERLAEILTFGVARRATIRVQLPLIAADESEPEPDLAVVPRADYSRAHPSEALLVIEVADSSLRKDRQVKAPLYAASGFREYWIVNVNARTVEVHRGPSADGWSTVTRHGRDETLHLEALPDFPVPIADILR